MALPGRVGLIGRASDAMKANGPTVLTVGPLSRNRSALLQVHEVLEQLVGGRDDLGVRFEATLGDDHVRELLPEVDVRTLERAAGQGAPTTHSGDADFGDPRVGRGREQGAALLEQTGRVRERRERDLTERLRAPVREHAADEAVLPDAEADERADA